MDDDSKSKDMVKYERYKTMMVDLNKAMKLGFYYQAIFIEYAIVEDRCASALQHAGVNVMTNNGFEIKLSTKLNKLKDRPEFAKPNIRKKLPRDLLEKIETWKVDRDKLVHQLANIPSDSENLREIAERGSNLVRQLRNKVGNLNRYFESQKY